MPIIHVKVVEGTFDRNKKQDLLTKMTDAVETTYPGLRDVTFVTIEDIPEASWGIGGESITAQKVAAHAQQKAKA